MDAILLFMDSSTAKQVDPVFTCGGESLPFLQLSGLCGDVSPTQLMPVGENKSEAFWLSVLEEDADREEPEPILSSLTLLGSA